MAKKKSRSANITRKREKRNRDRKSRQKQIVVEKQRNLHYGKMDEERLHTCLINSVDLLEEPELERVYFDVDLMYEELVKLLTDSKETAISESQVSVETETAEVGEDTQFLNNNDTQPTTQDSDEICEKFRTEVLRRLITPRFMCTLFSALTACENRLRRTGDRDRAEVAFVSHSLFEVVPPDIFVDHPLIQDIGMKTLRLLVEQPPSHNEEHPVVRNILSEVLENEGPEYQEGKLSGMLSNAIAEETPITQVESSPISESTLLISDNQLPLNVPISLPSPHTLPAKALYKNFDGFAIKEVLREWQGDTLEKETETQLELFNEDQELYITITENRVQLHTHSAEELTVAMEALESHCQSALMYLAKTYEEGGRPDATE